MSRLLHSALFFLLIVTAAAADDDGWVQISQRDSLTIFGRTRKDSTVKELRAVGIFDVPTSVAMRVIQDAEHYTEFMPYVVECRVLARDANSHVSYQRLAPPLVSERDYTVRVHDVISAGTGGAVYRCEWKTANDLGPAERPGTVRVKLSEGSWLLEPAGQGRSTRATYQIFTDCGGSIPAFIANRANTTAIPRLFDALRKQAHEQKYWKGESDKQ